MNTKTEENMADRIPEVIPLCAANLGAAADTIPKADPDGTILSVCSLATLAFPHDWKRANLPVAMRRHLTPEEKRYKDAKNPVLIWHGLAGDLLMAMPTFRAILEVFKGDITFVCGVESEHPAMLRNIGFTRIVTTEFWLRAMEEGEDRIDFPAWGFDVETVYAKIPSADLLINLCEGCGPAFSSLAMRLGVSSIGYHSGATSRLYWEDHLNLHGIDYHFLALQFLNNRACVAEYAWMPRRPDAMEFHEAVREDLGTASFLVIHADTKNYKTWPAQNWATLLQKIWKLFPDLNIVIVGYPAIPIETYANDERLFDCRLLPLTMCYELISMASGFIGVDSCMRHAADYWRIPTVAIFTAEYPARMFGPKFAESRTLTGGSPPSDISVDDVFAAWLDLLSRNESAVFGRPKHLKSVTSALTSSQLAYAPVSFGELIDKITILEIKYDQIQDPIKQKNVAVELDHLSRLFNESGLNRPSIKPLVVQLADVNRRLWSIEDQLRICEQKGDFDQKFIYLARQVYHVNDQRATLKRQINEALGSILVEEKFYEPYQKPASDVLPIFV